MPHTRIVLIAAGAVLGAVVIGVQFQGANAQSRASYDYPTDPPSGTVRCGQEATVKSSSQCGGKPATIVGGCGGGPRQTKCSK